MIKEFSAIMFAIISLLLVMGFVSTRDQAAQQKAQAALDRHADKMMADLKAKDGGREYFELKRLMLEAKVKEAQERYKAARGWKKN